MRQQEPFAAYLCPYVLRHTQIKLDATKVYKVHVLTAVAISFIPKYRRDVSF